MSGPVANNIFRSSGVVAAAAGGLSWQPVVTASTLSASAGNGYFINTTSNACTITLPSSAEAGDQIILVDYARTWGTNAITIDSNGLNFQGEDDTYTVDYDTSGQALNLVYSGATIGWTPSSDIVNALEPVAPAVQRAIFAFGYTGSVTNISNLVNSSGGIGSDVTGVGTSRQWTSGTNYGGDKAIFAFGSGLTNVSNLVNNSGVVAADTTGVGTARQQVGSTTFGSTGQAIFAFGQTSGRSNLSNLVSSSGVVATDTAGVGTARNNLGSAPYGGDKGIFAFGDIGSSNYVNTRNLVSNSGVIASDATGAGTARQLLAAAPYGGDKAIMAYGNVSGTQNMKNLVSNTGVVAADATGVGTARDGMGAAGYGTDKAIFAYGGQTGSSLVNTINLVNNSGVVASDSTGTGTARTWTSAAAYSYSA